MCNANVIAVPTENMSVTKPELPVKSDGLPTRSQPLRQKKRQQRPKTVSKALGASIKQVCMLPVLPYLPLYHGIENTMHP